MARSANPSRPVARVTDADLVQKRQTEIVEAATTLFAKRGFAKTVVRDVAKEANVAVGLVYEYVRTKEDILYLVYDYWISDWHEGLRSAVEAHTDPLEQLDAAVAYLVERANRQAEIIQIMYREYHYLDASGRRMLQQKKRDFVALLSGVADAGLRACYFRKRTDPHFFATTIHLLCNAWALEYGVYRSSNSWRPYARWVVETITRGWGTAAGIAAWERISD